MKRSPKHNNAESVPLHLYGHVLERFPLSFVGKAALPCQSAKARRLGIRYYS